jgi:hypothetical protein
MGRLSKQTKDLLRRFDDDELQAILIPHLEVQKAANPAGSGWPDDPLGHLRSLLCYLLETAKQGGMHPEHAETTLERVTTCYEHMAPAKKQVLQHLVQRIVTEWVPSLAHPPI